MPVITIGSLKGGVGKSTTAIYLASLATLSGRNVVVADCDPQGSSGEWLTEHPVRGVAAIDAPSVRTLARAIEAVTDPLDLLVIDLPPADTPPGIYAAAFGAASFVVVVTRPGGLEPTRVVDTVQLLERTSPGTPYGLVVVGGDPRSRNLAATLDGWHAAGVRVLGTIPNRSAIQSGPTGPLSRDGLLAYQPILAAILDELGRVNRQ